MTRFSPVDENRPEFTRPRRRGVGWGAALVAAAVSGGVGLGSCARESATKRPGAVAIDRAGPRVLSEVGTLNPGVREALERVYIAQGRKVVLPLVAPEGLSAEEAAAWTPGARIDVTLGTDVTLAARVFRVTPTATRDLQAPARWLSPGPSWRAAAPGEAGASGSGVWVAVAEAPTGLVERSLPSFARVGDRIIDLTWIPPARQNPDIAKAPMPQVSEPSLRALGEMVRTEATDPQRRWRVRLLSQRLGDGALWGDAPPPGFGGVPSEMSEPLEATAEQLELNARAALDALRKADAALALEVLSRLICVVRTPDGVLLPGWAPGGGPGGEGIESLLAQLLDPRRGAGEKAEAARRWLGTLPAAQAWIVDDVGTPDSEGAGRHVVTVGVCDLSGRGGQALALASNSFAGRDGEAAVAAFQSVALRAPMPTEWNSENRPSVEVSFGGFAASLAPIAAPAPVTPPGFTLGPLLEPWTLAAWRARAPVPAGEFRGGRVLIQRSAGGAWEAAITCTRGDAAADTVRLWFGPFGSGRGVLSASPDEGFRFSVEPGAAERRLDGVITETPGGGWSGVVTLASECFEPDRTLIVGVERESAGGFRGSFPRPMMPGQKEPGRVRLDLGAWDRGAGSAKESGAAR